ncbi:MAG TPA: methyltransferase domain-containing protein [Pseudonocardiaceae bacterium]|jgi:SAM-dependent methyltransferase|nr:methyltransferase domain-containing protein [Pseudonocardiaceae bacterium]
MGRNSTDRERYGDVLYSQDHRDEDERLWSIADTFDAVSRGHLADRGLAASWRCLDVGAGPGSITGWLATRVTDGEVVAVDRDVRLLADLGRHPRIHVRQADVLDPGFDPGRFDLVHSRFLLSHLREHEELIRRMASWLEPGGWLVLSDFIDLTSPSSKNPAWAQVQAASAVTLRAAIGTDVDWTRDYPTLLATAGLDEIGISVHIPSLHRGSPAATFMRLSLTPVRDRLVEIGGASSAAVDEVLAALAGPGVTELGPGMITAWARRPRIRA